MRALHVQLRALSAAYPYPFLRTGTQLTMPIPPFSTVFGNLSACAGRVVSPAETDIAVEFRYRGQGIDLERTRRLWVDNKTGVLRVNPETGLAARQFHVEPQLDIYLTGTSLRAALHAPAATPCLGRSQDIAWISFVREIELEPQDDGLLGPTLVPFPNFQLGGQILPPLVDYYLNDRTGYLRRVGRLSRYQAVPEGSAVRSAADFKIYHPSDSSLSDHVVYLHSLTA